MVVIYPNAINSHATMMVILDTALSTLRAMMHAWQLVDLTLLAVPEPAVILIHVIYQVLGVKVVIEQDFVNLTVEFGLVRVWVFFALAKDLFKLLKLYISSQ